MRSPHSSPSENALLGGLVFHAQQDQLFLADRLPLFDQDVALGEGVEVFRSLGRGLRRRSLAVTSGSSSSGLAGYRCGRQQAGREPRRSAPW